MRAKRHQQYFSDVKEDQLRASIGQPRKRSFELASHFPDILPGSANILDNVINASRTDIATEFHKKFVYGCSLIIWRKGRKKECVFFIDQFCPSFIWVSTTSKAFLFDLCFTTIQRFDYDL